MGRCFVKKAKHVLSGAFSEEDRQRVLVMGETEWNLAGEFSLEENCGVVEGKDSDVAFDVIILQDIDVVYGEEWVHSKGMSENSS